MAFSRKLKAGGAGGGPDGSLARLRARRGELAERVASLTWDLGGLTYEMAVRDHYRLDVLAKRAAELQQADAELGEIERLLASAESGVYGQCRSCGAVHSRGAGYCWRCGANLIPESRPAVAGPPAESEQAQDHISQSSSVPAQEPSAFDTERGAPQRLPRSVRGGS